MAHLTAQSAGPAPAQRVSAVPPARRRSGLPGTLRSEFTKIRSVRSTYWTLLVLLAAFTGTQRWRDAYDHALHNSYRFLSFGDCMLCWRHA